MCLDDNTYAWIEPSNIGEILVTTHNMHKTDCILSVGEYRLYNVDDQLHLTDLVHLELAVGDNRWQGYLLLTGLPDDKKKRARIVPTHEIVTDVYKMAEK